WRRRRGWAWPARRSRTCDASSATRGGAALVADEASDSSLAGALARDLQAPRGELHENGGWRIPFSEDEPLRVYVARKDAGGVRRLSVRSVDRGTLLGASIQIDGTGMTEDEIVREAARFYALATLTAYGAP